MLGKRNRSVASISSSCGGSDVESEPNIHDLNHDNDSEDEEEVCPYYSVFLYLHFTYTLCEQKQQIQNWNKKCIQELEEFLRKWKQQLTYPDSHLWMKGLMSRNVGGDISQVLEDLNHIEATGRVCGTTWGSGGPGGSCKGNKRWARNVMGYQVQANGSGVEKEMEN